jgi:putative restriction endonuclease
MEDQQLDALTWFEQNAGTTISWPGPLPGSGLLLAQRAKGIHKPKGWRHALSVRVMPGGVYPDEDPKPDEVGNWKFRYHQEEPRGVDPATHFTNRAMQRCLEDGIPVGVLRQNSRAPVLYEILGLGRVTKWEGGFFALEGPVRLASRESPIIDPEEFDPSSSQDARDRTIASITRRRGQPAFRRALLAAYGGRCAVSGCAVEAVLEAAHIAPYLGAHTNVVTNGLLLRADLHTLFDLGMLWIEPATMTVCLADDLKASNYGQLHGRRLRLPRAQRDRPSRKALASRLPTQTVMTSASPDEPTD